MKIEYFYDGQFRRVLKHLIRIFGEFQVSNGYDADGKLKLKSVPCRYADISRMTAYSIVGNSENVLPVLPIITINVQSLKLEQSLIQAPVQIDSVMGVNESSEVNQYNDKLDEIYHVSKFNPTPWKLTFNVNIATTTTTAKLELFEQIVPLFNPAVQLQMSENPQDWTALSEIVIEDCTFTTRSFPQGTETDLDIMILTFSTIVWFSLPATVKKANLIQQIVANIGSAKDEMDIELGSVSDVTTEVFTPKNMCIKTEKISGNLHEITLVGKNMSEVSSNNKIYSWNSYLAYLNPKYEDMTVGFKFQNGIEDPDAVRGTLIRYSEPNKVIVEIDESQYKVSNNIKKIIRTSNFDSDILYASNTDKFINGLDYPITIKDTQIPRASMFIIKNNEVEIINPLLITDYVYNQDDGLYYKFDDIDGWITPILSSYRQGYWRLTFK